MAGSERKAKEEKVFKKKKMNWNDEQKTMSKNVVVHILCSIEKALLPRESSPEVKTKAETEKKEKGKKEKDFFTRWIESILGEKLEKLRRRNRSNSNGKP